MSVWGRGVLSRVGGGWGEGVWQEQWSTSYKGWVGPLFLETESTNCIRRNFFV